MLYSILAPTNTNSVDKMPLILAVADRIVVVIAIYSQKLIIFVVSPKTAAKGNKIILQHIVLLVFHYLFV